MTRPLAGRTVAILVANGFEEVHMTTPQKALLEAGAKTKIVSPEQGLVNGWHGEAWGHYFPTDRPVADVLSTDFDLLLVPGGARSRDKLAKNPHTARLLRGFIDGDKPVVLLGHAVTLLDTAERGQGTPVAADEAVAAELDGAGLTAAEGPIAVAGRLLTARADADAAELARQIVAHFATALTDIRDAA